MSAWTPGPWVIREAKGSDGDVLFLDIRQAGDEYRGETASCFAAPAVSGGISLEERNANALLLSAAPDMHAALTRLLSAAAVSFALTRSEDVERVHAMDAARTALVKANGEAK